ncbi:tyrosine-protein phosphatase [Plantactinospora sp. S1510]|uniref:Tyrosine-protein phosphatase n=1 Tax=Plantactinospora alkalitolerans TaxID=2789879 RepID=A0ABS0H6Y5_9ACTN|nr:tyrosine-protein phosphatase [Plantactinospora alkalitolerans]MBF9134226.1 tyrosine-protein phosphatase [Plantactinospora alkalitolerans]
MTRTPAFATLFNFRDVGGRPGLDGRLVQRQRLYRSDSPHRIDGDDRKAFAALGIRTVIDLRRPSEVRRHGRVPSYDGLAYHHIHPEHAFWEESAYSEELGLARYLAERYHDLATTGSAGLVAAIEVIADAQAAPALVHCVAGKDRTGVVCALTLSVLGVADEDIAEDYARSVEGSARFSEWIATTQPDTNPVFPPFVGCPAEAMTIFLGELRDRHGSAERYLLDAGLDPARIDDLRAHLLT